MYAYTDIGAFILRLSIFLLVFSTFPLLHFFEMTYILNLFFRNSQVSALTSFSINFMICFIPLLFALFYPKIGTVLAYISSLSGFLIIYCYPIFIHLKHKRTQITNPLLAEAIVKNAFDGNNQFGADGIPLSPKIQLSDEFLTKRRNLKGPAKPDAAVWRKYYIYYALHMVIPIYGFLTVVFQFVPV